MFDSLIVWGPKKQKLYSLYTVYTVLLLYIVVLYTITVILKLIGFSIPLSGYAERAKMLR